MSWRVGICVAVVLILIACYNATATNEIIITSNTFKPYAEQLASIHKSMGINSSVVTIEEIWKNYTPAEDPPIYGCANEALKDITKYNYTLARKIIAFLRAQIGKVEYVTLFGDAGIIPPSYYFDFKLFAGVTETPTDFFYASPDYDMKPNFAVGRIPVDNSEEAETYINKLNDYYENFSLSAFRNALFYGGKTASCPVITDFMNIDDVEVWLGELSVFDLMQKGIIAKFNSTILMESDCLSRDEVKNELNKAFSGGYGIVFHSHHGTPDGITVVGPMYTKRDLSYLTKENSVLPIFISEGCSVAAYDVEFSSSPFLHTYYPPSDKSFAEYLLTIKAGAIASIGATRATASLDSKFEITDGFVNFTDFDYMHVITSKILEDISRVSTLGEAFKDALTHYSEKYNLEPKTPKDERSKWIYQVFLEAELLGDPTLKLPKLEEKQANPPKVVMLSEPEKYVKVFSEYSRRYYTYPFYKGEVRMNLDENVTVKVFKLSVITVPLIERKVVSGEFVFTPKGYGKYLIRISNGMSEVWYVFYAEPAKQTSNHPPVIEPISEINATVGESLIVHINASDPDGDKITCKPIELPEGARIDNFTFYWTPKESGDYMVRFVVTDSRGGSTEENITIHVVEETKPRAEPNINITPIYPPDGATNVPLCPTLKVKVEGTDNYTVEFYGDGKLIGTSNNGSIIWSNLKPGTRYEWFVIIKGEFGEVKSETWNFTTSYAPVADFKYTISGRNVKFTFTGYDPDGGRVKCYWDFGDGSKTAGCNVTHTYSDDGMYNVTLTVVDETNVSSSVTKIVIVKTTQSKPQGPPMSKDLDGDGLYEDVNGDGKFDYNDITYLHWNYYKPEFQKYKKYYDFWPDGRLNYLDVLSLYVYWKWGYKRW